MHNYNQQVIERAFEQRENITPRNASASLQRAVQETIDALDKGTLRVAEKIDGRWVTHDWLKKAVLLDVRINCSGVS